jgi:uncharacterized protein (UPF0335 family)
MKEIKELISGLIMIRDSRHTNNKNQRIIAESLLAIIQNMEVLEELIHKINTTIQNQIKDIKK